MTPAAATAATAPLSPLLSGLPLLSRCPPLSLRSPHPSSILSNFRYNPVPALKLPTDTSTFDFFTTPLKHKYKHKQARFTTCFCRITSRTPPQ